MDNIETIELSELVEGNPIFESTGISYLKVTIDGVARRVPIKIKSSGVSELIDEMRKKAPKPPIINVVVRPDDPAFRELGLSRKQHVKTFDLTDPEYLETQAKWQSDMGLQIVLKGIDLPFKDREGILIEDADRKVILLRKMGLTGEQFTQLVRDIQSLTKWQEEKDNDFLD